MHECMTGHRTARVGLIQLGSTRARIFVGRVRAESQPRRQYFSEHSTREFVSSLIIPLGMCG